MSSSFWTLDSGISARGASGLHRHARAVFLGVLIEVGVHDDGEDGGEAVEGGVGEVLFLFALGAEHEEAALGETGREIGTDDDLDGEELREGGGEDAEGGGLLGIESGEVVRQEVVGGGDC